MRKLGIVVIVLLSLLVNVCQADLIGHWKFDDESGTTAVSAVNSPTDDGILTGGAIFSIDIPSVPGGNLSALQLDGVDGWVDTPVIGVSGAGARTITAWIKIDDGNYGDAIVSWGDSWTQGYLGGRFTLKINNSSGELRSEIGGGFANGSTVVTDGQWHHVALTTAQGDTDMANVKFYVDGQLDAVSSFGNANPIDSQAAEISIGGSVVPTYPTGNTTFFYNGLMDDVLIYDSELNADSILALSSGDAAMADSPVDGQQKVLVDATINWTAPENYIPTKYDVYFGTDPNLSGSSLVLPGTTETIYDPFGAGNMQYETHYYWRVDSYEGSVKHTGSTWSFTTQSALPEIILQPEDVFVTDGEQGQFEITVNSISTATYEWKMYVDGINDITVGTDETLIIATVSVDDEGSYYCVITNTGGSATSEFAELVVKREICHWSFEGNTDDVTTTLPDCGGQAMTNDPNASATLEYGTGVEGSAVILDGLAYIAYPIPAEQQWQQYTVTVWVKSDTVNPANYAGVFNNNSSGADFQIDAYNSNYRYYGGTSVTLAPVTTEWVMIAVVCDGISTTAYYNGAPVNTVNDARTLFGQLAVGASRSGAVMFAGMIDDARIYNYAQTSEDIATEYYRLTNQATCLYPPAMDLTGPNGEKDCKFDLFDFAVIAADWLDCGLIPAQACN